MAWPDSMTEISYHCCIDDSMQPALFYNPKRKKGSVPLLVALHTWGGDYRQDQSPYAEWSIARDWAIIHPEFRGPNLKPDACGSEKVVADIADAVRYARNNADIDPGRIYLMGGSGGGYAALLMAGRYPGIWSAVSAWCPISDLTAWYHQCRFANRHYFLDCEAVCGGKPGGSMAVDNQYRLRSAVSWLHHAGGLPLDINAGISDGHSGSVPVSHSIDAYNLLAAEKDRISREDIAFISANREIPDTLKYQGTDPLYGSMRVLMRKISGSVRLTIFDGGHDMVHEAGFDWLSRQTRGRQADWSVPKHTGIAFAENSRMIGK